jgi:hypothetical protein
VLVGADAGAGGGDFESGEVVKDASFGASEM